MNQFLKIILGIVAVISVLCIAASFSLLMGSQMGLNQFIGHNPEKAREIGVSLLEYSLPVGYTESGSRNLGLIKMVVITPGGYEPRYLSQNMIIISTYPTGLGLSADQFQDELRLALLRSTENVSTLQFVRTATTMIKSSAVEFSVYESFGEYDDPARIIVSEVFEGINDGIVILFSGPIEGWDQQMVNDFLGSIR